MFLKKEDKFIILSTRYQLLSTVDWRFDEHAVADVSQTNALNINKEDYFFTEYTCSISKCIELCKK